MICSIVRIRFPYIYIYIYSISSGSSAVTSKQVHSYIHTFTCHSAHSLTCFSVADYIKYLSSNKKTKTVRSNVRYRLEPMTSVVGGRRLDD